MKFFLSRFFVFFIFFASFISAEHRFFEKKAEGVVFPLGFLKGVACSTYQNGGHHFWNTLGYRPESNWTWFENVFKERFVLDRERQGGLSLRLCKSSPINRGERVGISADGWSRMLSDIKLIKDLNCNAYRFELPWTDLNPKKGIWNEEAFAFFDTYIDSLLANGIEPMITLYHWVHPKWFHKLGAWEKEENIVYFVHYVQKVFERFGHKVKYWCTINEPTVISACGYILGTHAPGKKDDAALLRPFVKDCFLSSFSHNYELAAKVLGNLFKAHVEVYHLIKGMPYGDRAMVGIIHQMAHFKVHAQSIKGSLLKPISQKLACQFNKYFAHKTFMRFFETGHFCYEIPGKKALHFVDERAPQSLDFIGLNFYSDMLFGPEPTCEKGEEMTDMAIWAIRPQSMYEAIKEISLLNLPIIITENGICDALDNKREKWIIGYSNAVSSAIADGYDIRGYFYWSLLDNFEWNMGHNKKFGLYAVDTLSSDYRNKQRVLRKGAEAYRDYVQVAPLVVQ